ncbi:hypothetical protein WJ0W_005798 [Paenibacillus melissococcoides]|uniref:Collagen-like protein n=1 Tax=Paenibacillus melissococcoides TaxID=2912268 RepID=A0ABM9G9I0_9BACL|nr:MULTISPECIES: hypothetical protein [Paenibacillus]MEB9896768.1 hypothetical protein [Bacillus cereus]CAH8248614.1 hypothetical protein WJ0W_005798 [Paenibacillus melissococcoides]CAH8714243.1 hypothetical protein WDD9_003814 [Paenibacillus melissococcoides]CAH8719989.1 hypothetical protein HTL2_005793 [Paenibacillus melissococcoides]GIO79554.1 hypothetical protein J6TS7_31640 [Paenibacillus dendritiformis]
MYTTRNYKEPGGQRWVIGGELALEGEGRITKDGQVVSLGGDASPSPAAPAGLSAYEIAVEQGFEGSIDEWLASLVGPAGEAGRPGEKGEPGAKGPKGEPGYPTKEQWYELLARVAALESAFEAQGGKS